VSTRTLRGPRLWPWLALLALSLLLSGLVLPWVWPLQSDFPVFRSPRETPASPPSMARVGAGESRQIRLFFPQESGQAFREEERQLPRRATLAEEVRVALGELATPGTAGATSPLPPGTQLLQVFVDSFGIAYLDLSREFEGLRRAPGRDAEWAIASIVTTLTTSFQEIKRVQFLSNGQELGFTIGPLDLRYPQRPRFPSAEVPDVAPPAQE
jgi:hypothetical protein